MTARALHHKLTTSGARLFVEDDRLRIKAPEKVLTDELVAEVRASKAELIQLLRAANESLRARCYTLTIAGKQITVIATDEDATQDADIASFKDRWGSRLTCIEAKNLP